MARKNSSSTKTKTPDRAMTRTASKKLRPGWTRVTIDIPIDHLPIARAIAKVVTAGVPKEPCTLEQALSFAAYDGMIENEKTWLGTCSLDDSVRPWESEDDYPKTTLPMLALVKAVSGQRVRS